MALQSRQNPWFESDIQEPEYEYTVKQSPRLRQMKFHRQESAKEAAGTIEHGINATS